MQELLFQNGPIYWIGSPLYSILISLSVMGVLGIYMLWIHQDKKPRKIPQILSPYEPIRESDIDYVSKTLLALKGYLLARYVPHHVIAHTAEEIGKYIESSELRDIIIDLEHREYSGQDISLTDRTQYNQRILSALGEHI